MATATGSDTVRASEAAWARWLFASKPAAWIWLVVRVWLGYEWLHAAFEKLNTTAARSAWWDSGAAIKSIASSALAAARLPEHPQLANAWWMSVLHWESTNALWLSRLVVISEVVIGVALILGLFTGIAALLGLVLNFSYMFVGAAGVDPAFLLAAILLVLAWRNAGWIGLDGLMLPHLGATRQRTATASQWDPHLTRS
jgi:thiosulfate dehydrogenase [quinone] large subunit